MTPEEFDRVQQLFLQLRGASRAGRESLLADVEPLVTQEVMSLLAAHDECGAFLEHTVRQDMRPSDGEPPDNSTLEKNLASGQDPVVIDGYRLLQQIGEGGQGTVYMAEQKEPFARNVAIKLIKPGMDSKQVLARFQAERQALALMDHPSIARVIDGGSTAAGAPYFVMELVKGVPIDEFCDENQLGLEERLRLFLQVCSAVHHGPPKRHHPPRSKAFECAGGHG